MATEPTCEQRIRGYYDSRIETIGNLVGVLEVNDPDNLTDAELNELEERIPQADDDRSSIDLDDLREKAQERIWEMPLSVEVKRHVVITLGTGGPGDWFDCEIDEEGSISSIAYHFNDWFDHAEIDVSHDRVARTFCEQFSESAIEAQVQR